jgi:hypothetical protein
MKTYSAGTYLKISLDAGYGGMSTYYYVLLGSDHTEEELNDTCWQEAKQWAEMYGIYPTSEYSEEEISEDEEDSYSDNIEGYFEVASEEDAKNEGFEVWG